MQTEVGRRVFYFLRTHVVGCFTPHHNLGHALTGTKLLGCMQRDVAVPQIMIDLSNIPSETESVDDIHEKRLFLAMTRLCTLRRDFKGNKNHSIDFVDRARTIDEDLEDWVDSLPCEYAYMNRKSGKNDDCLLDHYHVYRDFRITTCWNLYRCARIMCHEIIMDRIDHKSLAAVSPRVQCRKSEAIMAQLSDDIAASVPFYLQGDHVGESSSYAPKAGVAGQSLIWPLFIIARIPRASSLTSTWAILQMEKIGRVTGIQQNMAVASLLKQTYNKTV